MKKEMTTLERMESFARAFLLLNAEQQKEAWEKLSPMLTAEELTGLKQYVGLYHLMSDQTYYHKIMRESFMIYKETLSGD